MGKITEALKKVSDKRISEAYYEEPAFQYLAKKIENTNIDEHILSFHDPSSPAGEEYKILRTHLQSIKYEKNNKIFLITSSISAEGKTVTSINLSISMAHDTNNKKTLLIDADMRKGKVARYLGSESHPGLSDFLQNNASIDDIIVSPGIENLNIIFSGKVPKHPSELLNSKNMEKLLESLKTRFDYIVIDSPPVMPLTDACILAHMVDGVILVVQSSRTQKDILKQTQKRLNQARAKILGFVMTGVEHHLPKYLHRYVNRYDAYSYQQVKGKKEENVLTG